MVGELMPTYKQNLFNGLLVGVDKLDMKEQFTVDCANIDTFTKGELSSMKGIEKFSNAVLGDQVDAVHQLTKQGFTGDSSIIIVSNGAIVYGKPT